MFVPKDLDSYNNNKWVPYIKIPREHGIKNVDHTVLLSVYVGYVFPLTSTPWDFLLLGLKIISFPSTKGRGLSEKPFLGPKNEIKIPYFYLQGSPLYSSLQRYQDSEWEVTLHINIEGNERKSPPGF